MNFHFSSMVVAGHEARGRNRAGIDHRIGPPVRHALDARDRIEGEAGGIGAELCARLLVRRSA